ncbi:MAG: hypothetical protein JWN44_6880 [Myxococcales bacterium]|nr:hypothetical protein [Myxococcales bacterium]
MHALARYWWVLLVRGLVALFFGVMVAIRPGPSLMALVLVFGAFALVAGAFALAAGVVGPPRRRWELIFEGLLGIGAGIVTFVRPMVSALGLYSFIAAWALMTGVLQIAGAIRLRKELRTGWMALGGVSSLLFGVLLIILPGAGLLALSWLIAGYAIAFGITLITLAVRIRRIAEPVRTMPPPLTQVPI